MNKAISYARCSRDENVEYIPKQHNENTNYAGTIGLDIHHKFNDSVSGYSDLWQHKELINALNLCLKEGVKDIVVTNLSRLTRSLRDGLLLLDWMHRNGIRLHLSNTNKSIEERDYLHILKELIEAEDYYWKFPNKPVGTDTNRLVRRPPNGYTKQGRQLVKSDDAAEVASVFKQAIDLRRRHPKLSVARIAGMVNCNRFKTQAVVRMLNDPFYTGRTIPRRITEQHKLEQYGMTHDSYITLSEFVLINSCRRVSHIPYSELIMCKNCHDKYGEDRGKGCTNQHLSPNGKNLKCQSCGRNISVSKLEKMLVEMCRDYIFNPDKATEYRFEHLSIISQLERIFANLAQQESGDVPTGVCVTNFPGIDAGSIQDVRRDVWTQWEQLKSFMRRRLQLGSFDVVLHCYYAMQSPDRGQEIKRLLERCFGGVFISFGVPWEVTIEPIKLAHDVLMSQNRIGDEQFKQDLETLDKCVNQRMQLLRGIMANHPFLMDYLSWNTVDQGFRQWESFIEYARWKLIYDPYI